MEDREHVVVVDRNSKKLTLYRKLVDGTVELHSEVDLRKFECGDGSGFDELAKMLGENILMDSPAAAEFFDLFAPVDADTDGDFDFDGTKDVAARRVLTLEVNGTRCDVEVVIGSAQPMPHSKGYYCPFLIHGLSRPRKLRAFGVDGVQALQLVMIAVGANLDASAEAKSGRLNWEGGEDGDFGFPVPDFGENEGPAT